jgi:hypothetical protein
LAKTDYLERETAFLQTQMREVRSSLADVAGRRKGLSEIEDGVAQRNMGLQLDDERERALAELNRITEDLRKLALVEQDRAHKDTEQQRQAAREDASWKESWNREEANKQAAWNKEEANNQQRLQDTIAQDEQQRKDAIAKEDLQLREAVDRQDRERTDTTVEQDKGKDRSLDSNTVADTFGAGVVAMVKAADVWLEAKQLMEHYAERQALEQDQQRRKEDLEKDIERQAHELAVSMNARGKTKEEIDTALNQQALIQEQHRAEQQKQFEKEQRELAARQAQLERERNERADRDSISL